MQKTTIVITRPLFEAAKLKAKLEMIPSFHVVMAPAIEFQRFPPPSLYKEELLASKFIFFPSKSSIKFFAEILNEAPVTGFDLKKRYCGVQGKGSTELFHELFRRTPDIISQGGEAESFVNTIIKSHVWNQSPVKDTLIVKGNLSRNILGPRLLALGINVVEWEIYNTVHQPAPPAMSAIDFSSAIILLFSPSAADALFRWKIKPPNQVSVVAFGPTTAHRANSLGFKVVSTLEEQDIDSLISNLVKMTAGKAS